MTATTVTADTREREDVRDPRLLMAVAGAVGLVSAFVLTVDKINLLKDPDKTFACDISPFVSCRGVMASEEASAFGFPNSLLGIIGFAVVLTLGVLTLARVEMPPFVWAGLQAGVLFGIGFVTWLQYQSIYDIGKLCPYCMVVWAVTIPLFVGVTARNLRAFAPRSAISRFVSEWTVLIVALWYVAVLGAIWFTFGTDLWA